MQFIANNAKDSPQRGMNAMKQPTNSTLSLFVGLLSSVIAACSGAGEDGLVTVGVRPAGGVAASSGIVAGRTGGLPMPGSDVMNQTLDGDSKAPGVADTDTSGASAGTRASAGSAATAERRGGAIALPTPTVAGAGGAENGASGTGGSLGPNEDECGAIPSQPPGKVTSGRVSSAGLIGYEVKAPNVFTRLRTTLSVPAEPAPNGQIFIWPGLQPTPSAMNLQPIGTGALLSALIWGPSCPSDAPTGYSSWWTTPMYSNISSSDPQYSGCHAGKVALAEPEQRLDIEIHADGTKWFHSVVNRDTMDASELSTDLNGQAQGRAFFAIELPTSNKPTEDVIFTHTVLTMDTPDPDACEPVMRGTNDFASKPRMSSDGKHCCIDRIVLRASQVAATTMDPP